MTAMQPRTIAGSPALNRYMRSLADIEAGRCTIWRLSEDDRDKIKQGAAEFAHSLSCADGAPLDTRLHLRTFFNYLRERMKKQTLAAALEAVDYSDLPFERGLYETEAREEIRHQAYVRVMAPRGAGF